ncbi:MAG: guanylate kinase [Rhodothermales bacterium]|nr:guanylate kinase [Rhodothermales bacterium]
MNAQTPRFGVVALTAPSGAGKTTIARRVLAACPTLTFSVSATTRPPRDYEKDGIHYYFIQRDAFMERVAAGDFLEHEEVYPGCFYGTLLSEIERIGRVGTALLDLDVRGAMRVKELLGDEALVLFIRPPSLNSLAERLSNRGTESPERLKVRLDRATMEMEYAPLCDHIVLNDDLETAVEETLELIREFLAERNHATTGI